MSTEKWRRIISTEMWWRMMSTNREQPGKHLRKPLGNSTGCPYGPVPLYEIANG